MHDDKNSIYEGMNNTRFNYDNSHVENNNYTCNNDDNNKKKITQNPYLRM